MQVLALALGALALSRALGGLQVHADEAAFACELACRRGGPCMRARRDSCNNFSLSHPLASHTRTPQEPWQYYYPTVAVLSAEVALEVWGLHYRTPSVPLSALEEEGEGRLALEMVTDL